MSGLRDGHAQIFFLLLYWSKCRYISLYGQAPIWEQMENHKNIVGPEIRRMRVEAGLSQEQLAAKIQVAGWDFSRGGLSKIEARLRRVNDAELLVLARALGCQVQDLYPSRVRGLRDVLS